MKKIVDLAGIEPCPIAVGFYDKFSERVANIETLKERNDTLADMQQHFEREVRRQPQIRNQLSEIYSLLKQECFEVV